MKSFFKSVVIFIGVILAACFLAPLIKPWMPYTLERVISRLVMVFVSIWMVVFLVRKGRWKTLRSYGFQRLDHGLELFFWGVVISLVLLAFFVWIQTLFGAKTIAWHELDRLARKAPMYIVGALFVGIFEEYFFRGVIFGLLSQRMKIWLSVAFTSFFYAIVHFFKVSDALNPPSPTVWDSFKVLATMIANFSDPVKLFPLAVGLFLFGVVLNVTYIRTRSLFLPIGIHTGAVLFLKFKRFFLYEGPPAVTALWGTSRLYDGVAGWIVLLIIWLFIEILLRIRRPLAHENTNSNR